MRLIQIGQRGEFVLQFGNNKFIGLKRIGELPPHYG